PFTGANFTTPNETYFAHVDSVLNKAAQKGMTEILFPIYLGYQCGDQGWCAEIQAASTADMQSWGRYVGNRYKNFDNLIWGIGGHADPNMASGVPHKMIRLLRSLHPRI